ncbi:aspartate/glutamate racemase family protein [Xanthobacter autotrophicus DSM 431]|uniref:aspartate/glutamate racemase family protein n=1 Tax=Xanthobacter nonsaccharivorans TaxID=3119912 RepID=UPI00372ABC5D
MTRLLLLNPNTNTATTQAMLAIARRAAPESVVIAGRTAPRGLPLITDEAALAVAADAVAELVPEIRADAPDGVILAGFGDPGLERLQAGLACPVTGIGEASMREAMDGGGSFCVVTTTPDLAASISAMAERCGAGTLWRGVVLTEGDVHAVMADEGRLLASLAAACRMAIDQSKVAAVIIGGGPLGVAADVLKTRFPIPIINPVVAAVRLALRRCAER